MRSSVFVLLTLLAGAAHARPVVVELFTYQGCSSCPPADRVLDELAGDPNVLPLAFHVDYWDHLGWKDAFSSPRWSERQGHYAERLGRGLYTPQAVVGGTRDVVGSRRGDLRAAITRAAATPARGSVELTAERRGARVVVTGRARGDVPGKLLVALVEDGLDTKIARGENAGLAQRSNHVVRELVERPVGELSVELAAPAGPSSVVAFVQAADGGEILAAARVALAQR